MKLIYCQKQTGNRKACGVLAKFKVTLKNENGTFFNYRCDCHKNAATQSKKVIAVEEINQTLQLYEVNEYLKSLIGKEFFSKHHKTELTGVYLKPNGVLMSISKYGKYKAVYAYQIQQLTN